MLVTGGGKTGKCGVAGASFRQVVVILVTDGDGGKVDCSGVMTVIVKR